MKTFWTTLASAGLVGVVCAALLWIPPIRDLEQQAGLRWLFALRGAVAAPDQVVMVVMNRRAAAKIFLPRDPQLFHRCADVIVGRADATTHVSLPPVPSRWPRCLHTQLVNKLTQAGAGVIAFDVLFRERPPIPGAAGEDLQAWQDSDLAATMQASARVVVAQKLEVVDGREVLSDVSPVIEDAALGSAPFPLVVDTGRRVDEFLAFSDSGQAAPTLPSLALQALFLDSFTRFSALLARYAGDDGELLPPTAESVRASRELQATSLLIRRLFRADPDLAGRVLDASSEDPVRTLVSLYSGDDQRLLNFYGPAGTIRAVDYADALASSPDSLRALVGGKAVFVGYSDTREPEQIEHFATVMSSADSPDLSGVEIAATAFANLRRQESLHPLAFAYWIAIVFLSGALTAVACDRLDYRAALAIVLVVLAGYGTLALQAFAKQALWFPVVLPMFVAAPAAMLAGFGSKYWTARRQREQLRRAFGYFVPREVVNLLERNAEHVGRPGESIECACVATDAANYTPLAETMSPEKLAEFLNRYYEALFGGMASRGGFVSDVVGDAMMAIWPHRSADTHAQMLNALLDMRDAADRFGGPAGGTPLITRFGAHWGRVALTTVGAAMHYEYRAVGDAVNTAARIQELNKKLGTRVLISHPTLGETGSEFLIRDVGQFLLRGKSKSVHLYELLGRRSQASPEQIELCARFADVVTELTNGRNLQAESRLRELSAAFPGDGPTAFYLHALKSGLRLQDGAMRAD